MRQTVYIVFTPTPHENPYIILWISYVETKLIRFSSVYVHALDLKQMDAQLFRMYSDLNPILTIPTNYYVLSHSVVSDSLQPHGLGACQASLSMGILQARLLEWVAMPSSWGSTQPRDQIQVSRIAGRFFTT